MTSVNWGDVAGLLVACSPVLVSSAVLLFLVAPEWKRKTTMPDFLALFNAAVAGMEAHQAALAAVVAAQAAADQAAVTRQQATQTLLSAVAELLGTQAPIIVLDRDLKHRLDAIDRRLDGLVDLTQILQQTTEKLMATSQDALDLCAKIDAATTAQGVALATESTTLQTISDEVDALIAKVNVVPGVDPTVMAALQAQADKIAAVSGSIAAQATFSTQIASKGANNPIPIPVPPPTP